MTGIRAWAATEAAIVIRKMLFNIFRIVLLSAVTTHTDFWVRQVC